MNRELVEYQLSLKTCAEERAALRIPERLTPDEAERLSAAIGEILTAHTHRLKAARRDKPTSATVLTGLQERPKP